MTESEAQTFFVELGKGLDPVRRGKIVAALLAIWRDGYARGQDDALVGTYDSRPDP